MRAYKFLNAEFGLKSLTERRLKLSRINELNDPFELTPYDITDPALRGAFIATRDQMHENRALLCVVNFKDGSFAQCDIVDAVAINAEVSIDDEFWLALPEFRCMPIC